MTIAERSGEFPKEDEDKHRNSFVKRIRQFLKTEHPSEIEFFKQGSDEALIASWKEMGKTYREIQKRGKRG